MQAYPYWDGLDLSDRERFRRTGDDIADLGAKVALTLYPSEDVQLVDIDRRRRGSVANKQLRALGHPIRAFPCGQVPL